MGGKVQVIIFRPINCLPWVFKLMATVIEDKICSHKDDQYLSQED